MIALMEKTCLMSVCDKIGDGNTTVGIAVNIKHLKASPVGSTIRCEAELVEVDRRRLVFAVKCFEGENLIGEGIHERFVVESPSVSSGTFSCGPDMLYRISSFGSSSELCGVSALCMVMVPSSSDMKLLLLKNSIPSGCMKSYRNGK